MILSLFHLLPFLKPHKDALSSWVYPFMPWILQLKRAPVPPNNAKYETIKIWHKKRSKTTSIRCTRLTLLTCQIWQLSESFGLINPGAFAVRLIFPALGASGVRSARTVKPTDICAAFFSDRLFRLLAPPSASPDLVSSPPSALKSWQSLPPGHSFWGSTKITLIPWNQPGALYHASRCAQGLDIQC